MAVVDIKVRLVAAKLRGDIRALDVFDVGLFIVPGAVGVFGFVEFGCPCSSFSAVSTLSSCSESQRSTLPELRVGFNPTSC